MNEYTKGSLAIDNYIDKDGEIGFEMDNDEVIIREYINKDQAQEIVNHLTELFKLKESQS